MLRVLLAIVSSLYTFGGVAQVAAGSQGSPGSLVRVDSVLVASPESLKPDQITGMQNRLSDWPGLNRYRSDNAKLGPGDAGRVVFLGDSITDNWGRMQGSTFFPGKPFVNRGIGGQTTPQMLIRFQQDVVALHPAAVLILAGTNDLAGNTGLSTLGMIEDNLRSMTAIAQANHIRVILASVLPVSDYPWRKGLEPSSKIVELNGWMKSFAADQHCTYLDYYSALVNERGGMKPVISSDGVHPTPAGYAVMAPLAQAAIDQTLGMQQGVPVQN